MLQEPGHIKNTSCFDFPTKSMFTFDVFWGRLGSSIFGKLSSATNNTRSNLLFRPSFRFLWLCFYRAPLVAASESSLDVELFMELVKQFGIQSLTVLKTARKRKAHGTKLTLLLVEAFQVKLLCNFFISELNTSFLSVGLFFIESFPYK